MEKSDLCGVVNVRTAAEFGGILAHKDNAHDLAVLFAEEHHGAHFFRLVNVGDKGPDGNALKDPCVYKILYLAKLLRLNG